MKLAKLSLAAITVVGLSASAFGADTLADAFKNGKVGGQIQSFYLKTSKDGANNDSGAYALGGLLKFKTASFKGFKAGFEFQTSHTLGVDVKDNGAAKDTSIDIQGSFLSEAYLEYSMNKTTLKVGRMHIATPLVSDSGVRLIRDHFTGATVVNTSLANTVLVGGAVTKWTNRDGTVFSADEPIYTAYVSTKFGPVGVTGQYVYNNSFSSVASDKTQDFYLEAKYAMDNFYGAAQYIGYKDDIYSSSLFGVKVGANFSGLGVMAAYNTTDDDGKVRGGWGAGNDPSYNSVQKLSGNGAGVDSYQGKLSYDFSKVGAKGLSAFTRYIQYDDLQGAGLDGNEWDTDVTYKFGGSLKGLKARIRYATVSRDIANTDFNDFRFIVKYDF